MPPTEEAATSELQDLEDPRIAIGRRLDGERDDAVGDRELGRDRDLVRSVLADPQGRRRVGRQVPREILEEPPERRRVRGERMQRLEAVDHEQPGPSLSEHRNHATERLGQRVRMAEAGAQVLVEHAGADRVRVEEGQGLSVPQDLLERLGDRREVDGGSVLARVLEHVLLRQDRLARSGQTHDDVDGVREQPSAQDGVEPFAPAGDPVRHRAGTTSCRNELVPRRSRTAETSWSGSIGFWRNADAPASSAASRVAMLDSARTGMPRACTSRHSSSPAPPEMRRSMIASCGRSALDRSDRVGRIERQYDLEPLGLEEVLGELGSVGVALGEQDHDPGPGVGSGDREVPGGLGEQPVRVARRDPLADPVGDEAEAFDILSRVQPMAPGAPTGLHEAVALLPRPERGRRDPHHACDRADAVGGDFGHDRPIIVGLGAEIKRNYGLLKMAH